MSSRWSLAKGEADVRNSGWNICGHPVIKTRAQGEVSSTNYLYIQSILVGIGTPPTPLPQASVPSPPPDQRVGGGGANSPAARGWRSPNSDDWRKSLALCLLCDLKHIVRRISICRRSPLVDVVHAEISPLVIGY